MNTNIDLFFITRRSAAESTTAPEKIEVEDGGSTTSKHTVTTMADSVRPLVTSMKLFGLYFRRETEASDKRSRWNVHMVYSLVVLILLWINTARMFSVFISFNFCLLCQNSLILTCLPQSVYFGLLRSDFACAVIFVRIVLGVHKPGQIRPSSLLQVHWHVVYFEMNSAPSRYCCFSVQTLSSSSLKFRLGWYS